MEVQKHKTLSHSCKNAKIVLQFLSAEPFTSFHTPLPFSNLFPRLLSRALDRMFTCSKRGLNKQLFQTISQFHPTNIKREVCGVSSSEAFKIFFMAVPKVHEKRGIIIEFVEKIQTSFSRFVIHKKEFVRPKLIFMEIQTDLCNPSSEMRASVVLLLASFLCTSNLKAANEQKKLNFFLKVFYHRREILIRQYSRKK